MARLTMSDPSPKQLITTVACPACGIETTYPVQDESKGSPDMAIMVCPACTEIIFKKIKDKRFKVMTATEFCYFLSFETAMKLSAEVQRKLGLPT